MNVPFFDIAFAAGEAPVAAAAAVSSQPSMFESLVPFLLIFVLMYFLMIRPQVKKAKEHSSLLNSLKVGDEVITSGGLIGRIRSIAEGFVVLDLGSTTVKVLREHITQTAKPKAAVVEGSAKEKN
jgi:preprotein translocase subunit YajC